jgi:hypothetical protein
MGEKMTTQELRRIGQGYCPDCGHRGFVIGPQTGLNLNLECGSLSCRARFNVAFYASSAIMAQRIEKRAEGGYAWASDPDEARPEGRVQR